MKDEHGGSLLRFVPVDANVVRGPADGDDGDLAVAVEIDGGEVLDGDAAVVDDLALPFRAAFVRGLVDAHAAALGDIVAATLALAALLMERRAVGLLVAWMFNLWGFADILNAFVQAGSSGLLPGQLGATYFLPTMVVPLLLVTHVLVFRILLKHQRPVMTRGNLHPA